MIIIIFVCVILIFIYVIKVAEERKYNEIMQKIPGPKPLPIVGNTLQFGSNIADIFANNNRLLKKYGSFYRFWMGSRLILVISEPNKLEKILTSNINIKKSTGYDNTRYWIGDGLLTSYGDKWRLRRKIITPAFHFNMLNQVSQHINSNLNILIKSLNETIDETSTDVLHHVGLFALDTISESAMKTKVGALENNDNAYVAAVKNYLSIHMEGIFSFYKQNQTLFKFTSDYKKLMGYVKTLHDTSRNVIKTRINERKSFGEKIKGCDDDFGVRSKKYFIDILLDDKDKGGLREEEVAEEVDTIMFAGHDTVSASVSFALLLLAEHQDMQQKILDELNEVLGTDRDYEPGFQDVQKLPYLDMFLKETLRFYTTVPFVEREVIEEMELDGIKIPIGTTLHLSFWGLHHNPEYFPNPENFDPDRFFPENSKTRHPFGYLPFSAGPRNCVGQKYAMMTMKIAIAKILRNFEITQVPKFKPDIGNNSVITSLNGIHVKLNKRCE